MLTHRAAARGRVDHPCRSCRCRPRRPRASVTYCLLASSVPAHAARRASAPLALPRHHRDITPRSLRCPSPRRCPKSRRPSAPTPPLLPAPSWRVGAARPVASSAPALAAHQKGGARLSRAPATTVISPCVLCAARHRAAAREHVDLQRRCRRCRPYRRGASALFALPRARRRPVPRADRAHLSRSLVTTVTSPRALCDAHHRAAVQEHVDLLRQRRRRRPRRRGASTLLALLRARRRPVPRADRARLSRAPATTVTSPRLSCAAHHRAAAQ